MGAGGGLAGAVEEHRAPAMASEDHGSFEKLFEHGIEGVGKGQDRVEGLRQCLAALGGEGGAGQEGVINGKAPGVTGGRPET